MRDERKLTAKQLGVVSIAMGMTGWGLGILGGAGLLHTSNQPLNDTVSKAIFLLCANVTNILKSEACANITNAIAQTESNLGTAMIVGGTVLGAGLLFTLGITCWGCCRNNPEDKPLLNVESSSSGNEMKNDR